MDDDDYFLYNLIVKIAGGGGGGKNLNLGCFHWKCQEVLVGLQGS